MCQITRRGQHCPSAKSYVFFLVLFFCLITTPFPYLHGSFERRGVILGGALHQSEDHRLQRARQRSLQSWDHVLRKHKCHPHPPHRQHGRLIRLRGNWAKLPSLPSLPSSHRQKQSLAFERRSALSGHQWWCVRPHLRTQQEGLDEMHLMLLSISQSSSF